MTTDDTETPERFERLSETACAAILKEVPAIEAALYRISDVLNVKATECACCHLQVKDSFREHQVADSIRGLRGKLRRLEEEAGGRSREATYIRPLSPRLAEHPEHAVVVRERR
jgi:hypothetical protein